MNTMNVLIRREFWEHRALWMAALVVPLLLLVLSLPMHMGHLLQASPDTFSSEANRRALFAVIVWGQTVPQYLVMAIVLSFYLLDCLYQERKDRSILFWKSLPVSDSATVLSKLLVSLVVVPLGVYLLAMVTSLVYWGVLEVRMHFGEPFASKVQWDTLAWLKTQALMLYMLIVAIFWYAPLAAFLLLVSAWARKNTFLWSTLPPLIVVIVERMTFGTQHFLDVLQYRTWGLWETLGMNVQEPETNHRIVSITALFDNVDMSKAVLNIDLWLGVAVAAGLVFAAIRIRRYRDDT